MPRGPRAWNAATRERAPGLAAHHAGPSFQGARPCKSTHHLPDFAAHACKASRRASGRCSPAPSGCSMPPPADAASPRQADSRLANAQVQALKRAGDAVVALNVTATEGATSAESLGQRRSGSGVVIGPDGLILTIGYLLLEAETIEVITQDDRTLPARQVAYDLATGFGLVRPLVPLRGVEPVPLARRGRPERRASRCWSPPAAAAAPRWASRAWSARGPSPAIGSTTSKRRIFTSPPVANHSGASLFNRNGELLGIGSLFVLEAAGADRALPGNMFVPVDLLRPVLAEMQSTGSTRASVRPWLGPVVLGARRPRADRARRPRRARAGGGAAAGRRGAGDRRHRGHDAGGLLQAALEAAGTPMRSRAHRAAGLGGAQGQGACGRPHADPAQADGI